VGLGRCVKKRAKDAGVGSGDFRVLLVGDFLMTDACVAGEGGSYDAGGGEKA